jgi:hypothetical protein
LGIAEVELPPQRLGDSSQRLAVVKVEDVYEEENEQGTKKGAGGRGPGAEA